MNNILQCRQPIQLRRKTNCIIYREYFSKLKIPSLSNLNDAFWHTYPYRLWLAPFSTWRLRVTGTWRAANRRWRRWSSAPSAAIRPGPTPWRSRRRGRVVRLSPAVVSSDVSGVSAVSVSPSSEPRASSSRPLRCRRSRRNRRCVTRRNPRRTTFDYKIRETKKNSPILLN